MSNNDLAVLEEILLQTKAAQDPQATDGEFFEFFSAEQVLRDFSLDPEEINSGIVGQESHKGKTGTDGGIDSMYLLVNGTLIRDVEQAKSLSSHKQNITFDVIIIQATREKGFSLDVTNRLSNTCESIFEISKKIADFAEKYNAPLLDIIERFRVAHSALLTRHPAINVCFFYVTRGDSGNIDKNVAGKAKELEDKIPKILQTVTHCKFNFVGARDLTNIFRQPRKTQFKLKCHNSVSDGNGGYVALVELGEYYKLISDQGSLREYLFESNVRDYEGDVDVNKQIRATLENNDGKAAFWWLNNGITILAEKVGGHSQELAIDDPRIVNGLQTSQEIFSYISRPTLNSKDADKRLTVIRVIESPDEQLQDKIIKATNSQTKIPPQYLRASDDVQRDIEQIFKGKGMHYDRRKNSWRRCGRNIAHIVGMTELAQSVAAIVLQEPDHARARPSRYFKQGFYERVFSGIDLNIYIFCAQLRKRVEFYFRTAVNDRRRATICSIMF